MKENTIATGEVQPRCYTYHQDPGHGWLEVPLQELLALGIQQQITSHSHMQVGKAYLEEDCDMPVFLGALKKNGIAFKLREVVVSNGVSFICALPSYELGVR